MTVSNSFVFTVMTVPAGQEHVVLPSSVVHSGGCLFPPATVDISIVDNSLIFSSC